jgi:hypothetical protein
MYDWRPYAPHPWIAIPPFGLMFGSFVPSIFLLARIAASLGIAMEAPARTQPHFGLFFIILLVTLSGFFVVGGTIGWFANALICRYLLGWPSEKIRTLFVSCGVPSSWLKWLKDDVQSIEK